MLNTNINPRPRNEFLIGCILLLTLILTRSGITHSHFGTEFTLPDATWAAFWMMGAFTAQAAWPMLLLIACVIVDRLVIASGTSDYCFTAAYAFLIPAYLSLWVMGRWSRRQLPIRAQTLLRTASSILLGTSICFVIANVLFYLAAGYFANMTFIQYAQAVLRYWPYYLQHTAIYAGTGLLIHYVTSHRASHLRVASAARMRTDH
jgi:hypothetical protein